MLRMNKKLQVKRAKKITSGIIDNDLFDFEAEIDSSLSFGENLNIIKEKVGYKKEEFKFNAVNNFLEAQSFNDKRSARSLFMDSRKKALKVFDNETLTKKQLKKWKKKPNRYDIRNVDYFY